MQAGGREGEGGSRMGAVGRGERCQQKGTRLGAWGYLKSSAFKLKNGGQNTSTIIRAPCHPGVAPSNICVQQAGLEKQNRALVLTKIAIVPSSGERVQLKHLAKCMGRVFA